MKLLSAIQMSQVQPNEATEDSKGKRSYDVRYDDAGQGGPNALPNGGPLAGGDAVEESEALKDNNRADRKGRRNVDAEGWTGYPLDGPYRAAGGPIAGGDAVEGIEAAKDNSRADRKAKRGVETGGQMDYPSIHAVAEERSAQVDSSRLDSFPERKHGDFEHKTPMNHS